MAFLFRSKQKNNVELARSTKELTLKLGEEQKPSPKVRLSSYEQHATADMRLTSNIS